MPENVIFFNWRTSGKKKIHIRCKLYVKRLINIWLAIYAHYNVLSEDNVFYASVFFYDNLIEVERIKVCYTYKAFCAYTSCEICCVRQRKMSYNCICTEETIVRSDTIFLYIYILYSKICE